MAPKRPRHPDKDLEAVIQAAEQRGWRAVKAAAGYYKLFCGCPEKHMKWLHLTPSDPNYALNTMKWLQRRPCWEE